MAINLHDKLNAVGQQLQNVDGKLKLLMATQKQAAAVMNDMAKATDDVVKTTTKYSDVAETIKKSNKGLARSFAGLSHQNKTWTFVSRMVSGSPFWVLQNKIRAISDGMSIFYDVQDKGMDRMLESVEVLNDMDSTIEKLEENVKNIEETDIFAAFGGDASAATKFYKDRIKQIQQARTDVDISMTKDRERREKVQKVKDFDFPRTNILHHKMIIGFHRKRMILSAKLTNFASRTWDFIKGISKGIWTIIKFAGRGLFIFAKVILIATLIAAGFYLLKRAYDRGGTFAKVVDTILYFLKVSYDLFVNFLIPAIIQFGTGFFNVISGAVGLIQAFMTGNTEKIQSSVNKIVEGIGGILVGAFKIIVGLIGQVVLLIPTLAVGILTGITGLTLELVRILPQALGTVFEAVLVSVFGDASQAARTAAHNVGEGVAVATTIGLVIRGLKGAGMLARLSTPQGIALSLAAGAAYAGYRHYKSKSAATGANFITSGPTPLMVGDNPGGREHVQVTPLSSANINGPKGGNVINVHVNGRVGASDSELNDIAKKVGKLISREISRSTSTNTRF